MSKRKSSSKFEKNVQRYLHTMVFCAAERTPHRKSSHHDRSISMTSMAGLPWRLGYLNHTRLSD